MLNDYDEWYCDHCLKRKYWSELIFGIGEGDICDDCYEEEE